MFVVMSQDTVDFVMFVRELLRRVEKLVPWGGGGGGGVPLIHIV